MIDYPSHLVQRLGERDFTLLASLAGPGGDPVRVREHLRREPGAIDGYLSDPTLFEKIFGFEEAVWIAAITPHLAFAALVYQTARDLGSASYVPEWVGAGERLPVFDATTLREFIDGVTRRYMLIDFLASFTRVASGSIWVRTARGYRRRRYSELDPIALAEVVEGLPAAQRSPGYRRLGEVSLFLTGVFPDHTARHPLSAIRQARLARISGVGESSLVGVDYLHLLEAVGRAWYDRAAATAHLPAESQRSMADMAENFTLARRFLTYLADKYLHNLDVGLMYPVA